MLSPRKQCLLFPPFTCSSCGELYGISEDNNKPFRVPNDLPHLILLDYEQARWWSFCVKQKSYVYAVCYPTGLPFYIGKGKAQRMCQHAAFINRNPPEMPRDEKELIIAELRAAKRFELYAVLAICESSQEAIQIEGLAIHLWNRRANGGLLTNLDEGDFREPETWQLPPPPIIAIDEQIDWCPWVIHPSIQTTAPKKRGRIVTCPTCEMVCRIPPLFEISKFRCPQCAHFFEEADAKLYRGWMPKIGD